VIVRRLATAWERLRRTIRDEQRDVEFESEIEEHVRLLAERYRKQGMAEEPAMLAARRQFGSVAMLQEDRRAMETMPSVEAFRSDLIFGVRMLRKNPAFALAAAVTLALGIGANTAIFSVCNAVLFKPLPYADPDRIVMLWERNGAGTLMPAAPANFVDWRGASRSFSEMAAFSSGFGGNVSFVLDGHTEAARLSGATVSSNFFSVLGVRFTLGRSFLPEEDRPGQNRVAILSHRVWQERFGAERDIAGSPVTLNDVSYTVVGVLPADFRFATSAAGFQEENQFDVWVPIALDPEKLQRNTHPLRVIARLNPGATLATAQAELDVIGANLARAYPGDNRDEGVTAVPLNEQLTANVRKPLEMLLGAVGLVLLLACANVANLLLGRAVARHREMAVRVALGASRRRLAQQLLTESLLLSFIGGSAGFLFALTAMKLLSAYLPADLSRAAGIVVDLRMMVFATMISLATGILVGLMPLVGAGRGNAAESLREDNRATGRMQSGVRNALAVTQIAIAIVLLIGAGLMTKSLWVLMHVAPGFRSQGVLTARLFLPRSRYPDNRRVAAFEEELLDRLRGRPGVQSAGFATYLPLSGTDNPWGFVVEGRPPLPIGVFNMAKYRPVSAGYFETIGIPLIQGRWFTASDTADSPWVVVISDSMARQYWRGENPIGQRLRFGSPTARTVIGVVGNVLHEGLDGETKPEMYVPVQQAPNVESSPTIVVRTALDSSAAAAQLRAAVAAIDRAVPVDRVETVKQLVSASVAQPRFRAVILATFSIVALAMASIGIYGVMNYLVIQRTREFGIRLSIGATRGDVLRLVLGRAAVLIGAGTALGLGGSVLLVRLIANLLFGTAPTDPLTFAAVPFVLAAVRSLGRVVTSDTMWFLWQAGKSESASES
jgi:putative ABC transport system permease protein